MAQREEILSKEQVGKFEKDGFLLVEDFLTKDEVESLRAASDLLVRDLDPERHSRVVFSTRDNSNARSEYFLNSGDKVRYFFEEEALDCEGNLVVAKEVSLNKIGHALHWLVPEFKRVTFSTKVKKVVRSLMFAQPCVVQSMYIFKQPGYGGEVVPHKDCTFLSTDPQSCVGLWFALEDATTQNGCLWFSPGSHEVPTKRRMIRNPDPAGPLTLFTTPPDLDEPDKYIPVQAKSGSLVIIDGSVDHKSERNTSEKSRHAYVFHIAETKDTVWDPLNWLQSTEELPFKPLYDN